MLPEGVDAVKADLSGPPRPPCGRGRAADVALRVVAAAACLVLGVLLASDHLWRVQAYPSNQLRVSYGAWGYEEDHGFPASPHSREWGYREGVLDSRSPSERAKWEGMASAGLRTFALLLGAALTLGAAAALLRRAPCALRIATCVAAVGVLVSLVAFGSQADEFYQGTGGGRFHASGRTGWAEAAWWLSWSAVALVLVEGALEGVRRWKAAQEQRTGVAVAAALQDRGITSVPQVAATTGVAGRLPDSASAATSVPRSRRGAVVAVLGFAALVAVVLLLWPERHDLRRMTREQVTPLMWAQEGKTAADLIRMFGPPSHRGVKGIFDGTVVFRWDADGGTVAVEFTDAAPPVGPETLEEHMRRQAGPDDVRLRQLHFATWSWEHD